MVKRPLAGYITTPLLNRTGVAELFDLRLQLEPWLAGLAAQSAAADWPAATETRAEDDDLARLAAKDTDFHDAVAVLAGNQLARQALRRLNAHFHIYRIFAGQGELPRSLGGHDEVAQAIRKNEKTSATRAMRRHLADSRAQLVPFADK